MKFPIKYVSEVRTELKKVTWPKPKNVTKLTLTVILISVVFGTYLGSLDFVFTKLLEQVLGL